MSDTAKPSNWSLDMATDILCDKIIGNYIKISQPGVIVDTGSLTIKIARVLEEIGDRAWRERGGTKFVALARDVLEIESLCQCGEGNQRKHEPPCLRCQATTALTKTKGTTND